MATALRESNGAVSESVEGLLLGSYRFTTYKSDTRPDKPNRILLVDADESRVEAGWARASATLTARDLMNEPASTLSPEEFARRARDIAEGGGLDCEVLDEHELAERGFGGLTAVGQGSHRPPRLIILRYRPDNPTGKVALVGKGVTFD